jgi:hypothetical protein
MNKLILTTCVFSILLSGCKNPFEANDKGVEQLNAIESRWDDAHTLASSTARIALATPVGELQNVKRDLEKLEVSECLIPAKEALSSYMNSNIANFLSFMADADYTNFDANKRIVDYFEIKAKCAGEDGESRSNLADEAEALKIIAEAKATSTAERQAKIDAEVKRTGAAKEAIEAALEASEAASEAIAAADAAEFEARLASEEL